MIGIRARRLDAVPLAASAGALAALAAALAHAAWPAVPAAALAFVFALAAATAWASLALRAERRRRSTPAAGGDLLARQLRVGAREAEVSRFQRLARGAPIGIVFVGRDGAIRLANDEYLRIIGSSRERFEGERLERGAEARARWIRPDLGARHEAEYVREDGTRVPVLVGLSRYGDGVAAFIVDLSVEKAAQRARDETEARLRAAAAALEEAHRRKDEFLGMLSHELRNPLAPIRNSVYLLRRGISDPALRDRTLGIVQRQVDHLTRLVDDLLDVTRITRGKVELRRERVELAPLLRRTVEDHRALAQASGVALRLEVPDGPATVDGDPTRLMQIAGNLIQNAIKFSSRGGAVTVSLTAPPGEQVAELRVRDEGAGIEPGLLEHIFEPFFQGERTLARSTGGLGLGLALVRSLAEMHGGTVRATSAGVGRGAEFTVSLPLLAPERPHVPAPALVVRPTGAQHVAHVLVVEDNRDVAESLRDLIEAFGHEVRVARSGDAALAEARRSPPDVVLCDIGLPGMSGYDVARAFRSDPALRHARLVAVTGYAQAEDRRDAVAAGFDRHVGKPPDPGELERLLA